MRIEVTAVDDFLAELSEERDNVYNKIVRIREDKTRIDGEVVTHYGLWCTALIGEAAILELGLVCGSDYDGQTEAAERSMATQERIAQKCSELGLTVRRGKIEQF